MWIFSQISRLFSWVPGGLLAELCKLLPVDQSEANASQSPGAPRPLFLADKVGQAFAGDVVTKKSPSGPGSGGSHTEVLPAAAFALGCGSKLESWRYAGVNLWFHLPRCVFLVFLLEPQPLHSCRRPNTKLLP